MALKGQIHGKHCYYCVFVDTIYTPFLLKLLLKQALAISPIGFVTPIAEGHEQKRLMSIIRQLVARQLLLGAAS